MAGILGSEGKIITMNDSSKSAGIKDIARLLRVSIGTVDRALHNRPGISEATKARVLRTAEQLGYRPNLIAQSLKLNRRLSIAAILPKHISYFFDPLRAGVRAAAAATLVCRSTWSSMNIPALASAMWKHSSTPFRAATTASFFFQLLAYKLGDGARVAVFTGELSTLDHAEKLHGFSDTLSSLAPHLKLLPALATDLFQELVPLIKSGGILATLYQRPYTQGKLALENLLAYLLQEGKSRRIIRLAPHIIFRSNLSLFTGPQSALGDDIETEPLLG